MSRLPKYGEAKAMRLASIAKRGVPHVPGTKADWTMAEELRKIGLLATDARGRFFLTVAGTEHMTELKRQQAEYRAKLDEDKWP